MKLLDLQPHWVGLAPGHAIGITFLCPHCQKIRLGVAFDVPIGGELLDTFIGPRLVTDSLKKWHRTGETFETLCLTPSIDASQFEHWHGYITNGEVLP